jgi:regulator of sigma E protease
MVTALIVLISLVLLIIGHELGHFLAAKWFKIEVPEFGIGFPPRITGIQKGGTLYSVNWLPFGGFVRIKGEDEHAVQGQTPTAEERQGNFAYQPVWKRSIVILAGVVINFIIGWVLITAVYSIGTPPLVLVARVQPDSPAAAAGLQSGDVVEGYAKADQFVQDVNAHKGEQMNITVVQGSQSKTISVTPRTNPAPGEGALGVELSEGGAPRENVFRALWDGLKTSGLIAGATILGFAQLIKMAFLHVSLPQDVVGPVGIFSVAQQTGKFGFIYLVQLVSLISINLAVLNLIPFPALDGGRFLLLIIEKIKGSPVTKRVEGTINAAGFIVLIALMVAITARDVARLF